MKWVTREKARVDRIACLLLGWKAVGRLLVRVRR